MALHRKVPHQKLIKVPQSPSIWKRTFGKGQAPSAATVPTFNLYRRLSLAPCYRRPSTCTGNILIDTFADADGNAVARPVLLDWGLAKQLPGYLRLAFSKFVYAAREMDVVLVSYCALGH